MTWLNALLAFSLAMVIFCTMASAVQELLQHLLHSRERWLRAMVSTFIDDTIRRDLPQLAESARDLASKLLENRAVNGSEKHRPLDWIAPKELFLRLVESEVGAELRKVAGAETVLARWSDRFHRMQGDASALFATRARSISVVVAIGLAFALNVDAVRLFDAFLTDDQLTAGILAQADAIEQRFADQQAATAGAATMGEAGNQAEQAFGATLSDLRRSIGNSAALGLPFGSHFFPYCAAPTTDDLCRSTAPLAVGDAAFVKVAARWLASVLLAGVLIGLGGPFWFNAFTSLSAMVQSIRAPSTATGKAQGDSAPAPETPADVARAAAEHLVGRTPAIRGRLPLTPRGTPL